MLTMLANWKGSVTVNGVEYGSIKDVPANLTGNIHITLHHAQPQAVAIQQETTTSTNPVNEVEANPEVRITVKKYMTQKGSPSFDFMTKWNHDEPMPLRTMVGVKVKETRGMVYMKLHGDIWARQICTCMCCGRVLTNPVSQFFGIGPECGGHNYVHPFNSEEELQEAVAQYKAKLQNTTWEGWVIKSAITEEVGA